jgi:DNA-binding NarL/FixJ family response regulator
MPVDVLLVEDHQVVRDGIRAILDRAEEFRVVGAVASGGEAVRFCLAHAPDLVLMDLSLPGLNGIDATMEILRHHPECRVVVLSMYDDENSVVNAIRAGARGFVLKKASQLDLLEALRAVAAGGSYLSPEVSERLVHRMQAQDRGELGQPLELQRLSPREVQVLRLVGEAKSSREIADLLMLEVETIRSYRKSLMKKLGARNAAQLTRIALEAGLISVRAASGGR